MATAGAAEICNVKPETAICNTLYVANLKSKFRAANHNFVMMTNRERGSYWMRLNNNTISYSLILYCPEFYSAK
jgi:hypothetical protein